MRILVTGGTGLIGSHLIEALIKEGHNPRDIKVLVRQSSDLTFLAGKGAQLCYGDLLDVESLQAAMNEVRIVFHCAAQVGNQQRLTPGAIQRANWRINFNGTEHLLEAACCAGVEKFIHVSTAGIHGLSGHYAASKLAAEKKVLEYAHTYGLKVVVIRPTVTLGERDRLFTKWLITLARRKVVPLIDGGRISLPFVHARDVASALILASRRDQAVGNAYDVAGFSASLREVMQFSIAFLGSRARIANVPYGAAYLGARLAEVALAVSERNLRPIRSGHLTRLARLMITGFTLDTSKIRSELAFEPQYGMEETLTRAIEWQRAHGA